MPITRPCHMTTLLNSTQTSLGWVPLRKCLKVFIIGWSDLNPRLFVTSPKAVSATWNMGVSNMKSYSEITFSIWTSRQMQPTSCAFPSLLSLLMELCQTETASVSFRCIIWDLARRQLYLGASSFKSSLEFIQMTTLGWMSPNKFSSSRVMIWRASPILETRYFIAVSILGTMTPKSLGGPTGSGFWLESQTSLVFSYYRTFVLNAVAK